jgi:hypothetical protein
MSQQGPHFPPRRLVEQLQQAIPLRAGRFLDDVDGVVWRQHAQP